MPVAMFGAATEQWEGMLREYALRGLGGQEQPYSQDEIAQAGSALVAVAEAVGGALGDPADVEVPPAAGLAAGLSMLQGILDDVRRLIISGELLVLPPLPEIVALRNWICVQATDQPAGAEPSPWLLESGDDDAADTAAAQWDQSLAPPDESAWLVGDDHNRIVAASPSALLLLGWSVDDLIGQRLLVVIPHALREAHIAGFTRSVVSGGGALLGKPLPLAALHRDGREIPITLTLTQHAARAARHVYLARLDAR